LAKNGRSLQLDNDNKIQNFSGLTHSAVKRPSFPSAKRYQQGEKKQYNIVN